METFVIYTSLIIITVMLAVIFKYAFFVSYNFYVLYRVQKDARHADLKFLNEDFK